MKRIWQNSFRNLFSPFFPEKYSYIIPLSLADTRKLMEETLTRTGIFTGPNIMGTVSGNTFSASPHWSLGTNRRTDTWLKGTLSVLDDNTTMIDIAVDTSTPFIVFFIAQIIAVIALLYYSFAYRNPFHGEEEKLLLVVILLIGGIIACRLAPLNTKNSFRYTFETALGVKPISIDNSF
jgi:hypothetical protein